MTIVCVDDHSVMLKGTKKSVEEILPDASIAAFTNADEALCYVKENGCDILISEIELCGVDGLALAKKVKQLNPKVNIIFLTVCDEKEYAKEVLKIKPSGYILKPARKEQLEAELNNLRYHEDPMYYISVRGVDDKSISFITEPAEAKERCGAKIISYKFDAPLGNIFAHSNNNLKVNNYD